MGNSPSEIAGRPAIVTGAMGIVFGIVRRHVETGANVLFADLDGDLATGRVAELEGLHGRSSRRID